MKQKKSLITSITLTVLFSVAILHTGPAVAEEYNIGAQICQYVQLEQAFEQDASVDGAEQASLENAATIFDREELSDLQFRDLVCRETYCKLSYEDHSSSAGASTIAENELFMALLEKYGDGVAIHGGEQAGRNRTFYIERNVSR